MKHGFTEEETSHGKSVQAAFQFSILVSLDRVGDSLLMELGVVLDHVGFDPSALFVYAFGRGAGFDGGSKVVINSDLEAVFPNCFFQAAGDFEFLRKEQHSRVGGKPTPQVRIEIHFHPWENTVSVGMDQSFGAQGPAYRQEAFGIAFPRVGKGQGAVFIE